MNSVLNVLVVDDSAMTRQLLAALINRCTDMRVAGEAENGKQAVQVANKLHPDVILMDIVMHEMDGLEATREIMHTCPTPIVLMSASLDNYETDIAFKAMKSGALTVLRKPALVSPNDESTAMLNTLRAMSKVHVIHHWSSNDGRKAVPLPVANKPRLSAYPEIIAIACSTGGPAALNEIISRLPPVFSLPIVIVQHITPDFVSSLVDWLGSVSPLRVKIAELNERPVGGVVYLAPGNAHLRINRLQKFEFDPVQGSYAHMPSCDVMLQSVAQCYGPRAIGVILTGMGSDGARGIRDLYEVGGFTIAQDEASSVVFGMPQEAIRLNAVTQVLPLVDIPQMLAKLRLQEYTR